MTILDVSRDFNQKKDGGSVVAKRNSKLLSKVASKVDNLFVPVPSLLLRSINFFLLQSYGMTKSINSCYNKRLNNKNYDFVFFDGSIYGGMVKTAKKKNVKTICFFHNVEKKYYADKAKLTKSFLDKLIIPYIIYNEKRSVRYSDYIVTLNERDSDDLKSNYGRSADFIWPTSFPPAEIEGPRASKNPYLLFVGTDFFANVEAVRFIIDNLSSRSKLPIKIVGSVCNQFDKEMLPEQVELVGKVDDLAPWYRGAAAMLLPIFSGSGLKTKTIEALRYGKYIIGSPEAFEGIEITSKSRAGIVCNDVPEFVKAIDSYGNDLINKDSIDLFNSCFSHDVALNRLKQFIDSIKDS